MIGLSRGVYVGLEGFNYFTRQPMSTKSFTFTQPKRNTQIKSRTVRPFDLILTASLKGSKIPFPEQNPKTFNFQTNK